MEFPARKTLRRFGLLLLLFCIGSIPRLSGAAPVAPVYSVPTGPLDTIGGRPDYYTTANWANSPPLAKFVDTLPGLDTANNLGQFLPVAVADTKTFPGSDYYIIKLVEYEEKMHSDLNPTRLRGYVQVNPDGSYFNNIGPHYLGPIIVARKDKPVRLKFINGLDPTSPGGVPRGGDLFLPVDESVMGAGLGPDKINKYSQNRANIHLHGGRTPWISDGTPHQWITPAGEPGPYTQGVSLQNVPDMCFDGAGIAIPRDPDPNAPYCLTGTTNPGPGASTYYFTNQQSTRLMFYHDHAFGITRLNVYAGEAAGYVITDPVEAELVTRGVIPADMIPLIIQDKTFVDATPTTKYIYNPLTGLFDTPITIPKVRVTDPLWNWGKEEKVGGVVPPTTGDLWLPHVYMPAQLPTGSGTGGVNPFGRWMYGPWFFPATAVVHGPVANPYYDPNCGSADPVLLATCQTPGQPPQIPGTPNVSMGMEAFQDSAVVNGTVFPTLTVDPKPYRLRILNAASDRFQNLSFYVADPNQVSPDTRTASRLTEVRMLPASAQIAAANNWPADWPVDGRDGGVPDPAFQGPSFIQIGTEGGFLPAPVVRAAQPVTYITDPTAFWVGVVDKTGLALGPAERADVIVDFSAYQGKTLILYNDAPAAWPARVPGYDYYTGAPDMRDSGGYGTGGVFNQITGAWEGGTGPMVGYAPNTRTVMQVIVKPGAGLPFNMTTLENEFTSAAPPSTFNPAPTKTLFERTQEPIIVAQAAYSSAYPNSYFPTNFPWEGINQINDDFVQFLTLAGEQVKKPTEPKGIHDEMGASFDPEYGRMSGNLAMQIPNPTTLTAVLILYGFSDIPTETVLNSPTVNVEVLPGLPGQPGTIADGTQIWKITHNGVDTHPIHFHIFDVQLLNRVGWDGQLALPEPNELGWKDTIKISPLMDTIVAVRPRAPALPFGIPNSLRPLNPAIPVDSAMGFTAGSDWLLGPSFLPPNRNIFGFSSIDWTTGQAYVPTASFPYPNYRGVVTNVMHDFGWEYVWHCHILSHEEMDMMRPIVLKVDSLVPPAFSARAVITGGNVEVIWNDPTPVNYVDPLTFGNTANEVGFNVYGSSDGVNFSKLNGAILPANSTTFTAATAGSIYKVEAFNAKGSTFTVPTGSLAVSVAATGPFAAPATVQLQATVAPAGNYSVAFYNGITLIGADSTAPYTSTWEPVMGGSYSITAKVTHIVSGVVSTSAPLTVTVDKALTANFSISEAVAGSGVSGVCDVVTLTSTSSTTGGAITTYSWSSGGTGSIETIAAQSLAPGVYPFTLTVSNAAGETASVTKNVTIINNPPAANANGPYIVTPGSSVILNTTGSSDLLDSCVVPPPALSYAWNIDNRGPFDYATASPTIPYSTLLNLLGVGTHTITLKVSEADGTFGTATATLTVASNAPPALTVPKTSTNGAYIVSWPTVAGSTYTLEEATALDFSTGSRTFTGLAAGQFDVTGRVTGSYYYRVMVDGPAAPSPWTLAANGCSVTIAVPTEVLADFSQPVLSKESQSPWENIIPNALADYFTYVPFTTADAVKLGFPATCGNLAKGDTASKEDCYTITAKKFAQPLAVQPIFGGGPGLRGTNGAALSADVYGYGSGGKNWTPPYVDTAKPGVVAGVKVTGNAPTPFVDGTFATTGIWHFPAPTIKGVKGRPVRVQFLNDLPNEVPTGLDPSVDCGPHAPNCFPYNRIVTHVHGAHVGPESDGLATAWYTPGFATTGEGFVSTRQFGPEGTYYFPMDQEASTIWYHDHAMGTTHNNVNMGLAGFFPITDPVEEALKVCNGLNCKPVLPTGNYELGFALQDRHFDAATGKFVMPDYPIYDLMTPGCVPDPITGVADDTNCPGGKVLWMKAKDPNNPADTVGHFVPFDAADTATLTNGLNGTAPFNGSPGKAPFGAPSATLEYFGNMPVVNGVVYGKYNVEPRVYRMRFLAGTDSRAFVMQLQRSDIAGKGGIVPFWVIGSEQGLLNSPVERTEIDLMPGERVDVLVDFTALPKGTRVMLNNLASDDPWGGYYDYQAQVTAGTYVSSTMIPEIMVFDVVPLVGTSNIKAPATVTSLRAVPIPAPPAADNTRVVSLMEVTDGYGRTMPTIDDRGFSPEGVPITEIIKLNDVEQWDIVNTTVDAHPMHLHQVAFQLIDRQALDMTPIPGDPNGGIVGFTPPVNDKVNQVFSPALYATAGAAILPDAWEKGWKDTIATPPGYVTRVKARFDLVGKYVWHCHILSHEEHDMMRFLTVVPLDTAGAAIAPAPHAITVPPLSVSGVYTVSWLGTAIPGVKYELQEATALAGTYTTITAPGGQAAPNFTVARKATGTTYYYRVRAIPPVASGFVTSGWTTGANGVVTTYPVLIAPAVAIKGIPTILEISLPPEPAGANVVQVQYLLDAAPLAISAVPPYDYTWTPTSASLHDLQAMAIYSNGDIATTTVVPVVVSDLLPGITWNAPLDNAAFDLGTPITLTATPVDVAGTTINWVAFYDGANMVGFVMGSTPGASYSLLYTPPTPGAKNLIARAFYGNGTVVATVAKPVSINGTVIAPASITVPATSSTGNYTVSWTAAVPATVGATYTLEESTTAGFTVGTVTVAASGLTGLSTVINGKTNGTYYYRVKAVKAPMTDSAPVSTPNNQCIVTVVVAAPNWVGAEVNNIARNIRVWWAASATTGATYTVTATPTVGAPIVVTGVAVLETYLTPADGVYTITVKADKAGWTSSNTVAAPSSVTVASTAAAPGWVGAEVNNLATTNNVRVWWATSATTGATYTVTATPTVGIPVVVTGVATTQTYLTLANETYTITVTADKAGFISSTATAVPTSVTVATSAAAPGWVGATADNVVGNVKVWWATSATPGATYTVTATPTVGVPVVVTGLATTQAYLTLDNGIYTISVKADKAGIPSSTATATASSVTVAKVAAAPGWVGTEVNNIAGNVRVWWATSVTPGATYTVTATPTVGVPVVVTGLATTQTYLTLDNGIYTITVKADMTGFTSSSATAAPSSVTVAKVASAPGWVGTLVNNLAVTGNLRVWWATSATPNATYTVTATPTVGVPFVVTGVATTQLYLTLDNGVYTITVATDSTGFTSSSATAAPSSVTIARVAAAPPWLGVAKQSSTSIFLWWPTSAIPGAGYIITETATIGGTTVVTTGFTTSGTDTTITLTGKPADTYSYTVQTTASGYSNSTATIGSAVVTLP